MKTTLLILLVALMASGTAHAQTDESRRILDLLKSSFESERVEGAEGLTRLLKNDSSALERWLAHEDAIVRAGVLNAWASSAGSVAEIEPGFAKLDLIADKALQREVTINLMAACIRRWQGEPAIFETRHLEDANLLLAAKAAIGRELVRLADLGTLMTEHRKLAALTVFGPISEQVLIEASQGRSRGSQMSGLAVSALARCDGTEFFCDADGKAAESFNNLLNSNFDQVKLAALYGAAFRGLNSKAFLTEMCRYLREDAFNEYTIEAALYLLHTRGAQELEKVKSEVDLCLKEFLDSLYSQRARYHAAFLMACSGFEDAVDAALRVVDEDCQFSSYWLVATALNRRGELAPEKAKSVEERAIKLALKPQATPQLRALILWFLEDQGRELPEGWEREAILEAVHESMNDLSASERDPDFYAIRSGLEVLSYLKDEKLPKFVTRYLEHESEAVRMAAAAAAGQAELKMMCGELATQLEKPFEYAGFAAAMSLDRLGDPRGARWLASYLASGNACLLPATLRHLQRKTGKVLVEGPCRLPSDYRRRSALWLAEFK